MSNVFYYHSRRICFYAMSLFFLIPNSQYIFPIRRATVVLLVPREPQKTKWRVIGTWGNPYFCRCRWIFKKFIKLFIPDLSCFKPIKWLSFCNVFSTSIDRSTSVILMVFFMQAIAFWVCYVFCLLIFIFKSSISWFISLLFLYPLKPNIKSFFVFNKCS